MFNTVKRIARSLGWTRPQKRRVPVVVTVATPAPENPAALAQGRQAVVAALKQVLVDKRDAATDDADKALFDFMQNGLSREDLLAALWQVDFNGADFYDDYQLQAFAAAVDYYCIKYDTFTDALTHAAEIIDAETYTYLQGVEDDWDLGHALAQERDEYPPEWLEGYVDWGRLGEDVREDCNGEFTSYGFFAPKAVY